MSFLISSYQEFVIVMNRSDVCSRSCGNVCSFGLLVRSYSYGYAIKHTHTRQYLNAGHRRWGLSKTESV